jgi:hypothetical protein
LSGTAASGAGIAAATVTANCASGTAVANTDANGAFTLHLDSGQALPCLLQVSKAGTPPISLYSYATALGQVNITPLTDLAVSKALAASPDATFANLTTAQIATLNAGIGAAKTYVQQQLTAASLGTVSGDLLTGGFVVGDANDHILDALDTALHNAGKTAADLRGVATGAGSLNTLVTVNPPAISLTGLAAQGAALTSGAVSAKCATGTAATFTSGSDGSFTLDLSNGQVLPCLIRVTQSGEPGTSLYSYATAAGHINVTPLTDMVVSRALAASPDAAFANFNSTQISAINAGLTAGKTYVQQQLAGTTLGTPPGDLLTGTFAIGDASDHVLDLLGAALRTAEKTAADLRAVAVSGGSLHDLIAVVVTPPPPLSGGPLSGFLANAIGGTYTITDNPGDTRGLCGTHTLVVAETSITFDGVVFLGAGHPGTIEASGINVTVPNIFKLQDTNFKFFTINFKADGSFNYVAGSPSLLSDACGKTTRVGTTSLVQLDLPSVIKRYARSQNLKCTRVDNSAVSTGKFEIGSDGSFALTGSSNAATINPLLVNVIDINDANTFGAASALFSSGITVKQGSNYMSLNLAINGNDTSLLVSKDDSTYTNCMPQ